MAFFHFMLKTPVSTTSKDEKLIQGSENIIVPVVFSVTVLLGGISNLMLMSVIDFIFLIFCVPFHAVVYQTLLVFWSVHRKLVHLVQYASIVTSILTLVAMSFDRYLAVGYPLRTKHTRTPKKSLCITICVWVLSILIALHWGKF